MKGANMVKVDLSRAKLSGAIITWVSLDEACLQLIFAVLI